MDLNRQLFFSVCLGEKRKKKSNQKTNKHKKNTEKKATQVNLCFIICLFYLFKLNLNELNHLNFNLNSFLNFFLDFFVLFPSFFFTLFLIFNLNFRQKNKNKNNKCFSLKFLINKMIKLTINDNNNFKLFQKLREKGKIAKS